jgi:hypothetical protein
MKILNWLPWEWIVRYLARSRGFMDPITIMTHVRRFAQPSEVAEPIELLRAGIVMHARGLMNSRAIQHNLDWVWPYWVERQFDPRDVAFVPRAFSITHINLTHRNWTAVGLPGEEVFPIVDPAGLVTPFWDSWSIDAWIVSDRGHQLFPSREKSIHQELEPDEPFLVRTVTEKDGFRLEATARMIRREGLLSCHLRYQAQSEHHPGWLVVSLRPCNPEGVRFVHHIQYQDDVPGWKIDKKQSVFFDRKPDRHLASNYRQGDVSLFLNNKEDSETADCNVGLATAAAFYPLESGKPTELTVEIPLNKQDTPPEIFAGRMQSSKKKTGSEKTPGAHCELGEPLHQFLFNATKNTIILLSPAEAYPGPYTYRRFWIRDAVYIFHALLSMGLKKRARTVLEHLLDRQNPFGYFHSQEGEWDSNGQVLWALERYCLLTGTKPTAEWVKIIEKGAHWIVRKRTKADGNTPHAGLLPAGFSAEHLGPNDYYFWDDFWALAGLESACRLLKEAGRKKSGQTFFQEAKNLRACLEKSLEHCQKKVGRPAMPASPYRRLDSGSIGSIVAGYPLHLLPAKDGQLLDTAEYIYQNCLVDDAFYQEIIHSGQNAYLTLHLAQIFLRADDDRWMPLARKVARLASPTGQWPEAIHVQTGGGCMGDGQHGWAAAEWILFIKNAFLLEELSENTLILGPGLLPEWIEERKTASFGPAPTPWGPVSVTFKRREQETLQLNWSAEWRDGAPEMKARVPGFSPAKIDPSKTSIELKRKGSQ